jgi:glucosamine-6-phosphate deaminase
MKQYDPTSSVEEFALKRRGRKLIYEPVEKIGVIEVENFPLLGKLAALRFIEWVQKNPGGVIALPTGKSPEHFIRWVKRILLDWGTEPVRHLLKEYGLPSSQKPEMKSLSSSRSMSFIR